MGYVEMVIFDLLGFFPRILKFGRVAHNVFDKLLERLCIEIKLLFFGSSNSKRMRPSFKF